MTNPIRLDFVLAMADDCSARPNAVAYHKHAMDAAARAEDPRSCRPGSPAVGYAYDEAARAHLSALVATAPPSMTTAERLLAAAILAARCEGRDLPIDRATFQHIPAIAELKRYAAEAPAIACGEGYWDDQDSACGDGMRQERSEAAELIRDALRALGVEAPAGVAVCEECFEPIDGEHSSQCTIDDEADDEAAEQLTSATADPLRTAEPAIGG